MPWELIQRDYPPVAVAPLPSPILNAADGWRGPCIFSSTLRLTCVLSVMHEVIALSLGQVMEALSTTMLSTVSFWQRFQVFSLGHPGLDKSPVPFWRSDSELSEGHYGFLQALPAPAHSGWHEGKEKISDSAKFMPLVIHFLVNIILRCVGVLTASSPVQKGSIRHYWWL